MQKFVQELSKEIAFAIAALKRWQTWLALGLIAMFSGLAFMVARMAFQTDSVLIYLHYTTLSCREMSNGPIIFLLCGMIFFVFLGVLTLGEFQQYLEFKRHNAHTQARRAMNWGFTWAGLAIAISAASLIFFNIYCR